MYICQIVHNLTHGVYGIFFYFVGDNDIEDL